MILEKLKTSYELWSSTRSYYAKVNLIKCIIYNITPSIFKKGAVNFLPISATLYINTICNYRCSFCFLINEDHKGSKSMNMNLETFNKILNSDFLKYAPRITLGGGEPYLNKNIFEFIKILKEKKKIVSIYTNGSLILRNYNKFIENQPDYLNISHYDDKFFELKQIFKKFNYETNKKSIVRLSKIINTENINNIESILNEAIETGFDRIIFQNFFPYKNKEKNLVILNDNTNYKKIKKELNEKYKDKIKIIWPNLLNMGEKFNCQNLAINTTIDNYGNIATCCFLTPPKEKVGNIFNEKNPWNSNEFLKFRNYYGKNKSPSQCELCYFKSGLDNRTV